MEQPAINAAQLPHPTLLLEVATQEAHARAARTLAELTFAIANDGFNLLQFRQALVFAALPGRWRLQAVSGLARPAEDSPYLVWLESMARWLRTQLSDVPYWLTRNSVTADLDPSLADGWGEWWPEGAWCVPLKKRDGEVQGWAIFLLDAAPSEMVAPQAERLAQTWGYCWEMLEQGRHRWRPRWIGMAKWVLLAAVAAALLIPVRQSALAPAEVVSNDAVVVTSPLDGVVKTFHVRPNQNLKKARCCCRSMTPRL